MSLTALLLGPRNQGSNQEPEPAQEDVVNHIWYGAKNKRVARSIHPKFWNFGAETGANKTNFLGTFLGNRKIFGFPNCEPFDNNSNNKNKPENGLSA